jgi:sporulation-control protein spo0M
VRGERIVALTMAQRNLGARRVSPPAVKSVIALVGACLAGLVLAGACPVLAQEPASRDPYTGFELAVSGPSVVRYDREARFRGVAYRVRGLATLVALPGRLRARFRTDTTRGPWREVVADAHGRFEVAVPIGHGDDAPRVEVELGRFDPAAPDDAEDDEGTSDDDAASDDDAGEAPSIHAPRARRFSLPISTRAPWEMTLYTDRRLYEPGEPVHVWALVRDGTTGAPIAGRAIAMHLEGAPIASIDTTTPTNAAGVAHYALTLGEHAPEGSVGVSLSLDDEVQQTSFQVGQRTWERIFAHAEVSPAEVQPGGDAEVRVHVTTPDATPIVMAEVSVMVGSDVGGSATTDAAGDAVVRVHAPAYLAGETGSTGIRVHVAHPAHGAIDVTAVMHVAVPLALEVDVVPTHGALVPEIDDVVLVQLSDALGEPPPAGTEIEVTGPAIPHGSARGRTDANGLVEIGVHLPIGASSGAFEEPHSTMRVHVLGAALERVARIVVPVSRAPEVVPTVLHPVLAPGAGVEVRLARRPSARNRALVVELIDPNGAPATVTYVAPGADVARLALPPAAIGRFSVRARAIHEDESLEGVGASTELLVVPPSPDFVSLVPERVRWQVGERARVDLVSHPHGPRAWGALLVRDLAAHGGEIDFTHYFLAHAFDEALLAPTDATGERLVRASLAAAAAVDAAPPVASPLVDALGLPSESSEAAASASERDTLRDPWPLARELARRGVGDAMRALEDRLTAALDAGGLDDLTVGRGAQRRFRDAALVELAAEGGLALRSLGEGDLTPAMIASADPSFTYEHVARRVARARLVALLVALATYVDPGDEASLAARTAVREPWQRWLARMVERGVIPSEALDDPWGGRFVLTPSAHPAIVLAPEAAGVELVSPGPDGRPGTADDVRDPFARVVPARTPYAVASGEDALMRQLAILSPVEATLAGLRAAYQRISAEMTEDEIGDAVHASVSEGTIGMGMLGTIGHGAGGGGSGYGYGSGSGALRGRSSGGPTVRAGGANLARLVRERFPPTVLFTPTFEVDPSGRTHLEIPLADAVTTYRVEAIVWREDGWVWSARTEITSDREIVVDAPIPTVAHVGDRLALPVRVSNRGATERTLRVVLLGDETLGIPDAEPVTVTVPAGDARAVPFEVRLDTRGEGSLRVVATDADGEPLDAVRRPIRVRLPARRVDLRREVLVEREGELVVEVPADAEAISGRVTLAVGADMFFHDFESVRLAWADPTDPRMAAVVGGLEARQPAVLGFAMGAACARSSFSDDTLRTAAEHLTAGLDASSRPGEDGTAGWTLLGLAPCVTAARPELASDLARLVDRIAHQVGDAAVTQADAPLLTALAAAALARAGGERMQPRARELLRRLDGDLVRVGDDLWLATPTEATTATLLHATADLALGDRQRAFALLATVARWNARGRSMSEDELALARAVALGLGGTLETTTVRMRVDDHDVELLDGGATDEPGVAAPGSHRVLVRAEDDVPLRAVFEARFGVPWSTPVDREGPFAIAIEGEAHGQDQVAELELVVRNRSPRWIAQPIVELSLPTGAELTAAQVSALRSAARTVSLADGTLTIRLRSLPPGAEGRVRLPIRWSVAGTLTGIGVAAHAADRDDAISVLTPTPITITARPVEDAAPPAETTTGGAP